MVERKQYPLRIDPALWDALKHWADDDLRSINAQLEYLLRQALKEAGRLRTGQEGAQRAHEDTSSGETS